MKLGVSIKINSLYQLYEVLPDDERIIVDVLRQIIVKRGFPLMYPISLGRKGFVSFGLRPFQEVE